MPSRTMALISSSVTLFSLSLSPIALVTSAVLLESNHTNGAATSDSAFMGLATAFDTFSAMAMPMRFGTSSPKMSVR